MSRPYRINQPRHTDHSEAQVDLENQFILRLPAEPADALREAIRSGVDLRDKLSIKLEPDKLSHNLGFLRRGVVKFDNWELSAKLVDLPTIIESQKTIDRKTFYKTADICQMLVCKEGEPSEDEEENEAVQKQQAALNKDPTKVDKRFLYPHGICPPLKNCRKRRFRKVLRKNFIETPEIEKEVRHLLRVDNDAVDVKWELVTEDELQPGRILENPSGPQSSGKPSADSTAIDERDLFGALSESDDEERKDNIDVDTDDDQQDLNSSGAEFNRGLQEQSSSQLAEGSQDEVDEALRGQDPVAVKLEQLRNEISQLQKQRGELQQNINNCDNQALLQRFRDSLYKIETEIHSRQTEVEAFEMLSKPEFD